MRYYGYSDKKSKYKSRKKILWFNIVIIVVVIAASVAFALVLGNYLKNRLENADISTEPIEHVTDDVPAETDGDEQIIKNELTYGELAVTAGYLDLYGCSSASYAEDFVQNLKDAGYSGVYFEARDKEGKLTFASQAASGITGGEMSRSLIQPDILKAALSAAENCGMKCGAAISVPDALGEDETSILGTGISKYIIEELYNMGFDEVILSGVFTPDSFTSDAANSFFTYISSLRDMCPGMNIGMVLDLSIFENPELTPTVELVFRYTDFFAVDFTGVKYTPDEISSVLNSLSGSFSAYCIRALANGDSVSTIQDNYFLFYRDNRINISFATPNLDMPNPDYDEENNPAYSSKIFPYSLIKTDEPESNDEGNGGNADSTGKKNNTRAEN